MLAATGKYPLGLNSGIYDAAAFKESEAPLQEIWTAYRESRYARSRIVCTNVAESGVTVPNVGLVISSGVQRRVSGDIRTGSTVNALQTLSKVQLLQQLGRIDQGVHIRMMSHGQYTSQVRSTDLAQSEESDINPMILRSLVAGRSFARLPFLCPPHPIVQARTKERMFLHGILNTKGVSATTDKLRSLLQESSVLRERGNMRKLRISSVQHAQCKKTRLRCGCAVRGYIAGITGTASSGRR